MSFFEIEIFRGCLHHCTQLLHAIVARQVASIFILLFDNLTTRKSGVTPNAVNRILGIFFVERNIIHHTLFRVVHKDPVLLLDIHGVLHGSPALVAEKVLQSMPCLCSPSSRALRLLIRDNKYASRNVSPEFIFMKSHRVWVRMILEPSHGRQEFVRRRRKTNTTRKVSAVVVFQAVLMYVMHQERVAQGKCS